MSEFINEWRWGQDSVYKLSLYYHRINDVEDLLPLTEDFEVPGNIGNGHRLGVRFETSTPLTWLGLDNAKLDFKIRLQDSSVTDPVTGVKRQLIAGGFFQAPPISGLIMKMIMYLMWHSGRIFSKARSRGDGILLNRRDDPGSRSMSLKSLMKAWKPMSLSKLLAGMGLRFGLMPGTC